MTRAPIVPTNPHAGVMATSPATAPEAAPSMEALPFPIDSISDQAKVADAVATRVFRKALAAAPVASRLDPALNPNQPTHKRHAPIMVRGRLCGAIDSLP